MLSDGLTAHITLDVWYGCSYTNGGLNDLSKTSHHQRTSSTRSGTGFRRPQPWSVRTVHYLHRWRRADGGSTQNLQLRFRHVPRTKLQARRKTARTVVRWRTETAISQLDLCWIQRREKNRSDAILQRWMMVKVCGWRNMPPPLRHSFGWHFYKKTSLASSSHTRHKSWNWFHPRDSTCPDMRLPRKGLFSWSEFNLFPSVTLSQHTFNVYYPYVLLYFWRASSCNFIVGHW